MDPCIQIVSDLRPGTNVYPMEYVRLLNQKQTCDFFNVPANAGQTILSQDEFWDIIKIKKILMQFSLIQPIATNIIKVKWSTML